MLSLNIDEKKNYNSLTNQYYFVILENNGYINMDPEMNWTQIQLQAEADSLKTPKQKLKLFRPLLRLALKATTQ